MFRHRKIRSKLLIGFLLMSFFVAAAGYIGVAGIRRVGRLLDRIIDADIPRTQALLEMRNVAGEITALTISFRLIGEETTKAEGDTAAGKKFRLLALLEELQKQEDRYRSLLPDAGKGELAFLLRVSEARNLVFRRAIELIDFKEQRLAGQIVQEKEQQLEAAQRVLQRVIVQALASQSTAMQNRLKEAEDTAVRAVQASVLVSAGAVVLALLFGFVIARAVAEPVIELQHATVQIAQGHLDKRVPVTSRDEIGQLGMAFNDMAGQIEELVQVARRSHEESERAKEEAERANRAKSDFLSGMSHELRTPLNAILGFAQLLAMDSLSADQGESVEHILKGGRHLLELINEVLDIARIETGRLVLSPEPVRVSDVLKEALKLVRPLADQRNISLSGNGAETADWYVMADEQRLKQVLLNLLANAIKYNRDGGAVTLRYAKTSTGHCRIKVSDTGPGIPPERMERLFMPFERLGAEQTGIEGTGLGLVLSKGLTEAMGGTMEAESTVGRGTTFWLDLPLVDGPLEQLQRMGEDVPAPAELEASSQARVVLYMEDNLSNVKLIQRLLAHRPEVRLLPAMQGRLGLDLARQHRPHLILLDFHLPDMPGEEVLRLLREAPETREIPVVVISADATPGQIERLLAAGAHAYLTKPIDVKKFLDVLDETLKG